MKKFSAVVKGALALVLLSSPIAGAADPAPNWHAKLGWSTVPMQLDLSPGWRSVGLPESGMTSYTLGATECFDDHAERCTVYWGHFNPRSSLYQATFGAQSISDFALRVDWIHPSLGSVTVAAYRYISLAVVSQNSWLQSFGLGQPNSTLVPDSVQVTDQGNGVYRLSFSLMTESDMGDQIPSASPFTDLAPPFSAVSSMVDPYHALELSYVAYLSYDAASDRLRAVYYDLATYTLKSGQVLTPNAYAAQQLESMVASVSWN